MSRLSRVALATATMLVVAALLPAATFAQITRGAISGTVRDSSGGVIPGATVTITNMDTNIVRTTVTDSLGFYRVSALEPGRYSVTTQLSGFAQYEQREILVASSREVTIDVDLKPAGVGENVTVTAQSPMVDLSKTSPTIGFTTDAKAVVELPLPAGRNINNLVLTVPNAQSTTGQGTYAVNGQRPRNNNYMIDGSDNNDISVTIATSQLVPEAVQEFQVLTNPYNVEFGRNSGGQINVITKSGTNALHGDLWDYYTTSRLYSLNNIEKAAGLTKPARYNRQQAGGDLGGRIVKNKTFFFALYQYDPQRPGPTPGTPTRIPTPAGYAALQTVPLGAGETAQARSDVLSRISFLQDTVFKQNPVFSNVSKTLVDGVPIETGQMSYSYVAPSTYHYFLGRVDHRISDSGNLTFRYYYNKRLDVNQVSNCNFGDLFCGSQDLLDTNLAASESHILTPRTLNEFRFSLVRRNLNFPENDPTSPTATITGLFTIGGAANFPQSRVSDAFQFSDTLTWMLDRHTLKVGADIRYNRIDNVAAFDSKGTFVFNSLQDYMNNLAFSFGQALQTASYKAHQYQTFWYVQDDLRLKPNLTLNLGLRYELSTVPLGMFGATDAPSLGALVPGPVKQDRNNWAPRVGFAWTPSSKNRLIGDGRTVLRAGYGIGYDILFYNLLTVNASNYPRVVEPLLNDVQNVYPNLLPVSGTAVFDPKALYVNSNPNTQNPMSMFYSFSAQRELGKNYLVEVGYTGSRGYHGINQLQANPAILTPDQIALVDATLSAAAIPGVQARRMDPQFGSRILIPSDVGPGGNDTEARSTYNAGFVSVTRRFAQGLQFSASYTYSRWMSNNDASLGEGGTTQTPQTPQDYFNYAAEWSRSAYDRPHRLAVSYIWAIPGPKSGVLGEVLGGWQISGVTQAQSGPTFTIRTGVDSNGDGNAGSDRPNINPAGSFTWDSNHISFTNNGYYVVPLGKNGVPLANSLGDGNAPRNSERGAGVWNTDVGLMKRFPIAQMGLMVRLDVFNLFKQNNYGAPNNLMNSPSFGQNLNNWGRRSMQVSAKVYW